MFDDDLTTTGSLGSFHTMDLLAKVSRLNVFIAMETCPSKTSEIPIKIGTIGQMFTSENGKSFTMDLCDTQTISQVDTCQLVVNCSTIQTISLFVGFPNGGELSIKEIKFNAMP